MLAIKCRETPFSIHPQENPTLEWLSHDAREVELMN